MKHFILAALLLVSGPALASNVRIVVPAHDIARGDTVSQSDLTFATVAGEGLMGGTVTTIGAIDGMQARRVLRAGEPLQASDMRRPVVVTKGQTVTMLFNAPGVELSAMGRALGEGGVGDTVSVQNPASFRIVGAVITGPGTVRASGVIGGLSINQLTARK